LPTSSDDLSIECVGITKDYRLGEELSLQRSLARLARPWRRVPMEAFRALDDVSFKVPRGAFFGIVGPNGSGKSTLTQVLSGITVPTAGEALIWGRILPLLEVGAGFHDELTGRENIYLLGSILGLPAKRLAQLKNDLAAVISADGWKRRLSGLGSASRTCTPALANQYAGPCAASESTVEPLCSITRSSRRPE